MFNLVGWLPFVFIGTIILGALVMVGLMSLLPIVFIAAIVMGVIAWIGWMGDDGWSLPSFRRGRKDKVTGSHISRPRKRSKVLVLFIGLMGGKSGKEN